MQQHSTIAAFSDGGRIAPVRRRSACGIAAAACLLAVLAACQGDGSSTRAGGEARDRAAPAASQRTPGDVPAGGTGESTGSGATEGPHEGKRASTPPGTSRDGQPPVGGAIVDPSGAVTGKPPPPGMR